MRELKFRAWDGGELLENITPVATINNNCFPYPAIVIFEANGETDGVQQVDFIEQYTGLKDKNGKEIYEGDIVKARWRRAKHAKLDTMGEIKYGDGWFYIYDDPDGQDRLCVPIHNCYNVEVIGNIHENPELLGKEQE